MSGGKDLGLVEDRQRLRKFSCECDLGIPAPLQGVSIITEVAVDIDYVQVDAVESFGGGVFLNEALIAADRLVSSAGPRVGGCDLEKRVAGLWGVGKVIDNPLEVRDRFGVIRVLRVSATGLKESLGSVRRSLATCW